MSDRSSVPAAASTDLIVAPVAGRVLRLADVPDPVFAEAMVGPGLAIDPERELGDVLAPVGGRLSMLQPHAFVVSTAAGHGVLVHLGIDTVQLQGAGFTMLADVGQSVTVGQPLVRWDPRGVEHGGRSPVCPVIALDARSGQLLDTAADGAVHPGDLLFRWT